MKIVVNAGADPLRVRRHTRDLQATLAGDPGLQRHGVVVEQAASQDEPHDGSKGIADDVGTLIVSGAGVATARYLLSAMRTWLDRPDRNATITLVDGKRSLNLTGDPSDDQERVVREFLDAGSDRSR